MQDVLVAEEALDYVLQRYSFKTVLDIGSGQGLHAERFRAAGKFVVTIDSSGHWGKPDILGSFLDYEPEEQFDLIWCSHVLEHQLNPGLFLGRIFCLLKAGGVFAISVPPLRTHIVGGHVSVWNGGLLSYHLVLAGFDCRNLAIKQAGYNISVIGRKRFAVLPPLHMDRGDIEKLAIFFPVPAHQKFDGSITEANWTPAPPDKRPIAGPRTSAAQLSITPLRDDARALESEAENLQWSAECVSIPGVFTEFGVYAGKSLRLLAAAFPERTVIGFDSFKGLPEAWPRSETSVYLPSHFALKGMPKDLPANTKLVPGFFDETLRLWKSCNAEQIALLHIDSDLYSSAKHVLTILNDRIVPGTIVVFDELCDWKDSGIYPKWPEGEWRALAEWMAEERREVQFLSRGPNFSGSFVVAR